MEGESNTGRAAELPPGKTGGGAEKEEGEEEMKFKVSTTVTSYKEVMAIVQALAGVVNNIDVTDCEGKEDEDDDDQI